MVDIRHWVVFVGALGVSACNCHGTPVVTNSTTDSGSSGVSSGNGRDSGAPDPCASLSDLCIPDAGAGQPGACADHDYCDPVHKTDPAFSKAVAACHRCYFEPRQCKTDSDCCPGQRCNPSLDLCFDCYNLDPSGACGQSDCTTDDDCVSSLGPGHVCLPYNSPDGGPPQIQGEPPSMRCTYPTCKSNQDCATGATCFPEDAGTTGYCVLTPPCGGSCAQGTACSIPDDLCSAVPPGKAGCQQSCAPGTMLVFKDESVPTGIYDACNRPAVDCTCATLPPLRSRDLGRYSSLAAANGQVWVSAYDGQYGDLVVYHFQGDGTLVDLEYVDGVPSTGKVVGDPNGPRHGIADPGPNVGLWTSIALGSDGEPRVSYYDVDHKSLKFAVRASNGAWTISWVDGWDGSGTSDGSDVGQYTSIAMQPNGNPAITYFQAAGPEKTAPWTTAAKIAIGRTPNPAGPSDWTLGVVDAADRPAPPCGGACGSSQVCVGTPPANDGGPTVLPDGGCLPPGPVTLGGTCEDACGAGDAGCGSGTACVATDAGASCQPVLASAATGFVDLPEGVGLFTSLAFTSDGTALVAYYDRLHGDLRLAVGNGSGFTATTIDGSAPGTCADTGDVGLFPSLKVNPTNGAISIAYQDSTDQTLLYWTGKTATPIAPAQRIVVDTGTIQPPDGGPEDWPMFVGASASLAFGQSGAAYLAYQNQTQVSLRLSSEPAGCATATPASCQPSVVNEWASTTEGFYAQVAIDGSNGYVSSAQIKALANGVDNQLLLEGPIPLK